MQCPEKKRSRVRRLNRRLRSEEHTSELQSPCNLVCRLLLEKKNRLDQHPAGVAHPTRGRPVPGDLPPRELPRGWPPTPGPTLAEPACRIGARAAPSHSLMLC